MRWSKPKDNYLLDWFAWRLFLLLPYRRETPFRDWLLARAGNWVFIHRGNHEQCDCQNPIENGGFSEGCEIHTVMSETDRRTQQWLRELETDVVADKGRKR